MDLPTGKRVLSAIQPTGTPHIGNYLGALKQWVALQSAGNRCFWFIADLHAITAPYDASSFQKDVLTTAATLLAIGVDPEKSTVFIQSQVPAHAEAAWYLQSIARVGELGRMTQFKEKSQQKESASVGLFTYPVLQAADVLLYGTEVVPVGEDQLQHLEFVRTLARKFNRQFGGTFTEPQPYVPKDVARIMSLADPSRKMSKSDPTASYIALLDEPTTIRKKIRAAVTDSGTALNQKRLGPALLNLLTIAAAVSGKPVTAVAAEYDGRGYVAFKEALTELLVEHLAPIRARAEALRADPTELRRVLARGAERAAATAYGTLTDMKERMGLTPRSLKD